MPPSWTPFTRPGRPPDQVRQKGQDFLKTLTQARERLARKMALQEKELAATGDRDRDRMYGDLITANLYPHGEGGPGAADGKLLRP